MPGRLAASAHQISLLEFNKTESHPNGSNAELQGRRETVVGPCAGFLSISVDMLLRLKPVLHALDWLHHAAAVWMLFLGIQHQRQHSEGNLEEQ